MRATNIIKTNMVGFVLENDTFVRQNRESRNTSRYTWKLKV